MANRRRKRGVLNVIRYGDSKKKKKTTVGDRIKMGLAWVLGVGLLLAMLSLFLYGFLFPTPTIRTAEADVVVQTLAADPPAANVTIEGLPLTIPLSEDERATVTVGTRLHVTYAIDVSRTGVRLKSWLISTEPATVGGE